MYIIIIVAANMHKQLYYLEYTNLEKKNKNKREKRKLIF